MSISLPLVNLGENQAILVDIVIRHGLEADLTPEECDKPRVFYLTDTKEFVVSRGDGTWENITREIKEALNGLNNRNMTLGLHTDGLMYLFVNGVPVGNGVAVPSGSINGDVVGNVDSGNNIVLFGQLTGGPYKVKYEMENGTTVDIGTLVLDDNVYYSVFQNLANCVSGNSTTQLVAGKSYSTVISANSGYSLSSIIVTMGGIDITSVAVTGTSIHIPSVAGDVIITATAVKESGDSGSEPTIIVNQIPISTDESGSLFIGTNGEVGYKTNTRLSVSGGERSQSGHETTGYIPVSYGDTVYIKGITVGGSTTTHVTVFYDSNYNVVVGCYTGDMFGNVSGEEKSAVVSAETINNNNLTSAVAYMRISAGEINADSIITVNQPIEGSVEVKPGDNPDDSQGSGSGSGSTTIVNQIPLTVNADGSKFIGTNGEVGYKTNTRLSISSGGETSASGLEVTGYFPVKYNDVVYLKGIQIVDALTTQTILFFDSSFNKIVGCYTYELFGTTDGEVVSAVVSAETINNNNLTSAVAYMRISAGEINADSIITVNQPIE